MGPVMSAASQPLVASNGSGQLHGWQAVAVALLCGLPFAVIGFILVTNYKGLAHRFVDNAAKPPFLEGTSRRVNLAVFGSEEKVQRFNRDVMPKIVGWPFLVVGVLISGGRFVVLLILAVRAAL